MTVAARPTPRWINWLLCAAIVVTIAVAYANTLHAPFIFDDYNAIINNTHMRSLLPLSQSMTEDKGTVLFGRPLVCFSMAVNYHFAKIFLNADGVPEPDPLGFHLFNIATHMIAALLLFGLIRRTLLLPRWEGKYISSATWIAGAATLIWAVHPIQTESVTYITQRTETMMAMFLLLTLYAVSRASQSRRPLYWSFLAILACAAGMASKEISIIIPLVVALYDWIFLGPRRRGAVTLLLYIGLALTWIILPIELSGADWDSKSGYGTRYVHRFDYLKTQAGVILYYLRLCFWPRGFSIDYFDWPIVRTLAPAIIPGTIILTMLGTSIYLCIRRHWAGFLGGFFFLVLGPTSSFLPNFTEVVADRRMYLPLISVILITFALVSKVLRGPLPRTAAVVLIVGILTPLTIRRNGQYHTSISIWTDTVDKHPSNARAHFFLGLAYAEEKNWDQARLEDYMSLNLMPNFIPAHLLQGYIAAKTAPPGVTPQGTPVLPGGSPIGSPPNPPG